MSKTFRENYYDGDNYGMKKAGKSKSRQKVKDYLRKIDLDNLEEDEELDINDKLEEIDESN